MHTKYPPALTLWLPGVPRTKENKGQFNKSFYFKTHEDIVEWECKVNHAAIAAMKSHGFTGPYMGRCRIVAAMHYESWKRCDVTNYWKSLNDALNGAVWVDDSQVDSAEVFRFVDRVGPGVYIMVWFYDYDFNEQFSTGKTAKKTGNQIMKYPSIYDIFEKRRYEYISKLKCISKPEDAAASRYSTFIRLKTMEERKREKGKSTKPTRKRRQATSGDNKSVERPQQSSKQRRSTGNGIQGSKRRSGGAPKSS